MKIPRALSEGEETLALQLKEKRIRFVRQFKFCPSRKWLADFALDVTHGNILIEFQGGIWTHGGHVRGKQYQADCEKMAEAVALGWKVLWFTIDQIKSGYAINVIERVIKT